MDVPLGERAGFTLMKIRVLILIVMDVPLGESRTRNTQYVYIRVLILIVMDVPLGGKRLFYNLSLITGLNPYCNGCTSRCI